MRHADDQRSLRLTLGAEPAEPLSRAAQFVGAGLVALGLGVASAAPLPAWLRPLLVLIVVSAAFAYHRAALRRTAKPCGYIVVDDAGVHRVGAAPIGAALADGRRGRSSASTRARVIVWGEPFGVTLLANRAKDRVIVAVTTPSVTRYVGVRITDEAPEAVRELLVRASIASDDDVAAAMGEDAALLSAIDAIALVSALSARAAGALERIYLTAPRGERVELDGSNLRIGERTIDLAAPLEWRAFLFHESGGRVATLYQATWVRQADAELFLIAPNPGEIGYTDEPPPREMRLAIDRLFMLPLRRALERAPRASRPNLAPARVRTERRA